MKGSWVMTEEDKIEKKQKALVKKLAKIEKKGGPGTGGVRRSSLIKSEAPSPSSSYRGDCEPPSSPGSSVDSKDFASRVSSFHSPPPPPDVPSAASIGPSPRAHHGHAQSRLHHPYVHPAHHPHQPMISQQQQLAFAQQQRAAAAAAAAIASEERGGGGSDFLPRHLENMRRLQQSFRESEK